MDKFFDKKNSRIIFKENEANPQYWDSHWATDDFKDLLESSKDSRFILRNLEKYMPDKRGKILEGGCGRGQIVYCMQKHGYSSIGIDYAENTVKFINKICAELDVQLGDVRKLNFPDNYFKSYWSLGVIEHFYEGYDEILNEMGRVLSSKGILFLSFPYMSPLRKIKAKLGFYNEYDGNSENFYQFSLNLDDVIEDLEKNGFEIIEINKIDGIKGFKDEVPLSKLILQPLYDKNTSNIVFTGFKYILSIILAQFAAHIAFIVAKNRK